MIETGNETVEIARLDEGQQYQFRITGTWDGASVALEEWSEAAGDYVVARTVTADTTFLRYAMGNRARWVASSVGASTALAVEHLRIKDVGGGGSVTAGTRPLNATKAFNWIIYGSPSNGHTINVNGRTLTKAASVGTNAFSTLEELVTKINEDSALYAYRLDSKTVYVEAVTPGAAGNSIVLSSATFRCTFVGPPTAAPGTLVEGVDGIAATKPTYIEDPDGNVWFTMENTINGANWKRVAFAVDTVRPNSDPDFVGARPPVNLVGNAGDVILRYYNDLTTGNTTIPAYSDGETPMGRCAVPAFGQKSYATGDFFDLAENIVGFPVNCEIGILGTKVRLFGRVHVEFGSDLPGIWFAILGSTQTEFEQNVGLTTSIFPSSTGKMVVDLDLDVEFKDATGNGPQGYESFYYLDVLQDRSLVFKNGVATPTFGLGFVQRSSTTGANHHEPCGSTDKEVGFAVGRVGSSGTEVTTTKVTYRLFWEIIPPSIWKDS